MHEVEVVLSLLVATTVLVPVARRLAIPYPILLVIGGLIIALLPAVPLVVLEPDLVFLLFLPPLLYIAAYDTSIREIKTHFAPIFSLSVGLTLATTLVVGWVAYLLMPSLGLPAAFALGAIVSPPDAVAATAILRRIGAPRQIVTILEGESLFNDATALVAYQTAVAAIATASFSFRTASLQFVFVAIGGIVVGFVVGLAIAKLRGMSNDSTLEITTTLLTPFAAWVLAEQLHVSGVLATVTVGLSMNWWAPRITAPETRLRGRAVWDMFVFVLQSLVFILLGLQLSSIIPTLSDHTLTSTVGVGLVISLTVIVVRFAWVFGISTLARIKGRHRDWRRDVIVSWVGMRGVVSLATALALPFETPERDVIILVAFCVILVTLVGQGLSLPYLIRALGLGEDTVDLAPERGARLVVLEAAQSRISELAEEWPAHRPLIESLQAQYEHLASHLETRNGENGEEPTLEDAEQEELEHRQIFREVIDAERAAVLDLRIRGEISDEIWRRIERELDHEALRTFA